jgi:hypothetical protein
MVSEYRGVQLLGDKSTNRIEAIQTQDIRGDLILLSPVEYLRKGTEPPYRTLPWEEDLRFRAAKPKTH